MNLQKATYEIEITSEEAYSLGCIIGRSLESSIKNHYNNLQQNKDGESVFFEQEKRTLKWMGLLFGISGYPNMNESFIGRFQELFINKRKEREKNK